MSDAPQKLKPVDTVLYTLAMGTGLRWIAVAAAVGPSSLPLWLLALLIFYVPLAVATAALTERFEGHGGIYEWARDTMGPLAGFLCGWSYWVAQLPYFAGILYFLGGLVLTALGGDPKDTPLYVAISVAVLALVTGMQLAGLRWGKWLPNIGTAGGWAVLAVVLVSGAILAWRGESATTFLHAVYVPSISVDTAILWGTIVFAYSGTEAVGFLRNEVEGGMRTIRRTLAIVGIGSLAIYVLGTVAFLVILPHDALSRLTGFPDALRQGLVHVGAGTLASFVIAVFALSMLGQFTSWFGVAARLPFAAGIDSFLPASFGRRSPRTGAPVTAILLQAALTLAMIVLSQAGSTVAGAYDFILKMQVLTAVVPYLFMFAAYLLTVRLPAAKGAWTLPGGARAGLALGIVGLASTAVAILCSLVPNAGEPDPIATVRKTVVSFLAMMAIGAAFYWLGTRRRAAAAS